MKKLNLFLIALTLVVFNLSASPKNSTNSIDIPPVAPTKTLQMEIVSFLGTEYPFALENNEAIEVLFTLNSNHEIIVISTNSQNKILEDFIKEKLNYKKVHHNTKRDGELFLLPLKITK